VPSVDDEAPVCYELAHIHGRKALDTIPAVKPADADPVAIHYADTHQRRSIIICAMRHAFALLTGLFDERIGWLKSVIRTAIEAGMIPQVPHDSL